MWDWEGLGVIHFKTSRDYCRMVGRGREPNCYINSMGIGEMRILSQGKPTCFKRNWIALKLCRGGETYTVHIEHMEGGLEGVKPKLLGMVWDWRGTERWRDREKQTVMQRLCCRVGNSLIGFSSDSLVFCDQKRGCDLLLALKGNCQKHMKKKKTSSKSLVFFREICSNHK